MTTHTSNLERFVGNEYPQGFVTTVATDKFEPGLSEAVVRMISARKNEPDFMLQWRLQAYRHWLTLETPTWSKVHYPAIDYDAIIYYAAPKSSDGPKTLDDIAPEFYKPTRSWAYPYTSVPGWLVLPWTRCLIVSLWPRPFRRSWQRRG